jgi:site-specific recombinase XerC
VAKKQSELGLYQRQGKEVWYYDFEVNGERFTKSTRCTTRREAVKVARAKYAEATGLSPTPVQRSRKDRITLDRAFTRYWEEKGCELADAKDLLVRLDRIAERLGRDRFLDEITYADLHDYVQRRKRDGVANRTVNSDVPESIRRAVRWARKWGVERGELGNPDFDWNDLKLDLPRHRIRWLTRREKAQLLWAIRKDYRRLLYFAMRSGLRLGGLLPHKDDVLWEHNLIRYKAKSKYENDTKFVPMTGRVRRLVEHCCNENPLGDYVFTYVAQRSQPREGIQRGQRVPINARGFERAMRDAIDKIDLKDWRLIHDLRHTAATDLMSASQNPAAVKAVLGHSTIDQTMKYGHVLAEDVLAAMEKVK